MLGPPKARRVDRPVLASLEALVPPDNFYRHLARVLDLSFVRDLVRDHYPTGGRPSLDPVVFFQLQLILFFEGLRSERQLLAMASLHLAHRWYLGYALDEPLPDHSTLSRIRQRLGLDVFRCFFDHVVERCREAGLVWGRELYIDATKVEADAAVASLRPRFFVEAHLQRLFQTVTTDVATGGGANAETDTASGAVPHASSDTASPLPTLLQTAMAPDVAADVTTANAERHDWIVQEGRPDRTVTHGHYQRLADLAVSTTDPDATLMPTGGGARLGYQTHYVVDGGKARIILQALVTPAEVMENQPALDLVWRTCFRWDLRPRHVAGDTKYGTVENVAALERAGIRASFPLKDWGLRTAYYGPRDFVYDAARDGYVCPQGQALSRAGALYAERIIRYRAPAVVCNACPAKAACTPGRLGRVVHRSFDEAFLDRVRAYHATAAYLKAMRKRSVWVEPMFGEAKQWHGLRRCRLRGLPKVNMQALLTATGQNLKRLLRDRGWGRRPWPGCPAQALGLRRRQGPRTGAKAPHYSW
jgi:transposase